jgi:hypothetical protein
MKHHKSFRKFGREVPEDNAQRGVDRSCRGKIKIVHKKIKARTHLDCCYTDYTQRRKKEYPC